MERFLKSRYKIGDKISENPFSVTYKGSTLSANKPLVIKIYKRGMLNSNLINRMKQKVKEFSLILDPGIARLIDGDYGWQGFYYVREYVEGQSLHHLIESGQGIGEEKTVEIACGVCRALELAHTKGIVHGALKPGNIFIDTKGRVKLTDFVIEGEIKESMPQKVISIMEDGGYLSPEELSGQPASVSSDIYAAGIILCEMLIGKTSLNEKGLAGGLKKIRGASFVDKEVIERLPGYLRDVIKKALQADPLLRFSAVNELRESLEKKALVGKKHAHEELMDIFENTVTQYGGEELSKESESLEEVGQVKIRWGKEKHRNWILALVLAAALLSGMVYAFLFSQ